MSHKLRAEWHFAQSADMAVTQAIYKVALAAGYECKHVRLMNGGFSAEVYCTRTKFRAFKSAAERMRRKKAGEAQ